MDVIFEGAISRSWGMQDVLRAIMTVNDRHFAVLRVASPATSVSGRITICDGSFIVGAVLSDGSETGYAAVRRLLSLPEGNFALLDLGQEQPPDFDQTLCLAIEKVLGAMPMLPADPCELFDEKTLLDKVFGADTAVPRIQQLEISAKERAPLPALSNAKAGQPLKAPPPPPKGAWNFMQPLLKKDYTPTTSRYFELEDTSSHKNSLNKLRGTGGSPGGGPWYARLVREAFMHPQAMVAVAVLLVVLVAAAVYFTGSVNQNNWLNRNKSSTMQKDE